MTYRRWWRQIATISVCTVVVLVCLLGYSGRASASQSDPPYYVAVGASESVGWQPSLTHPYGQRTDTGYTDDLLRAEQGRWNGLQLVSFGCPGDTTSRAFYGHDRCHPTSGSQLGDALSFLHLHPSVVLVTIDLGYNNLLPCLRHQVVNEPCVSSALSQIHQQLSQIVSALRAAGSVTMRLIGVGHNDPFLGDYLEGSAGQTFVSQTLDVFSRFNDTLHSVYGEAGVPMADVAAAYDTNDTEPTSLGALGSVPMDVARICELTWMCRRSPLRPNIHPNDAGYEVIADAIGAAISDS